MSGQYKRKRTPQSCEGCRVKKSKCDRHQPCEACLRREEECVYEDPSVILVDNSEIEQRLYAAEREIARLRQLNASRLQDISKSHSSNSNIFPRESNARDAKVLMAVRAFGDFSTDQATGARYHSRSAATQNIYRCLPARIRPGRYSETLQEHQRGVFDHLVKTLVPSKLICDILINHFETANSFLRFNIHLPSFRREHESFWKRFYLTHGDVLPEANRPFWLALLLSILSASLRTYFRDDHPDILKVLSAVNMERSAYRLALKQGMKEVLEVGKFMENYDLDVVQALLVNQLNVDIAPKSVVWMNTGMLVHIAQSLGLHRDPANIGLPQKDWEFRRRLWMCIVVCETSNAWGEGLPSQIHPGDYDCLDPSYDVALDGRSEHDCSNVMWNIYLSKLITFLGPVSREIRSVRPLSFTRIIALDAELQKAESTALNELTFQNSSGAPEMVWRGIVFDSIIPRLYFCIHLPFLQNRQNKLSRERIVSSAKRLLKAIHLLHSKADDIESYRWLGATWMMSMPFLATVVLGSELIITASKDLEAWSLIDNAYHVICEIPELVHNEHTQPACDVIDELRKERRLTPSLISRFSVISKIESLGWLWAYDYLREQGRNRI
ncbi:putative transcriptional regulatory protein [Neolecta irregularis DAH-3]|uniref:Putative transcriptional regulatory protein n=1 Tax=Neolecta irregularis (strain DAH-3) TaxID=1198029 RepID=A0A1U7LUU5_NEOID|nr:putative transcriptional regulatory protein [Neolecta irregularis DAH-3]|eukprot:OLL26446.1 putative transcriptional regulatory protein [Neolecta irregularis DAH-3]